MKQKIITTYKAIVLVVELPEGAYSPNICQLPPNIGVNYFLYENGLNTPYKESLDIPKGNWQLLGRMPEITEEQWKGIVDEPIQGFYAFYSEINGSIDMRAMRYTTSTESGLSLLQANHIYFDNPLGRKPHLGNFIEQRGNCVEDCDNAVNKWHEAQSKVFDKERCYLFIKED